MTEEKDFSNVTTIGEMHAIASNEANKWTPRDALIRVLRMIDAGEIKPDALVVVYREKPDTSVTWALSSPSNSATVGMLGEAFLRCREHRK